MYFFKLLSVVFIPTRVLHVYFTGAICGPRPSLQLHCALQWVMQINITPGLLVLAILTLPACDMQTGQKHTETTSPPVTMNRTGWLASDEIMEASGMQASHVRVGDFFVHNDEGEPILYAIDESGTDLGSILIVPAKNKDWEDITSVPFADGRWIAVGDIGDNKAKRKSIKLYFVEDPSTGEHDRYSGRLDLKHSLSLTYPDGPRDCEAMAYDPQGDQILLLTKRDKPARLYAVDLETALTEAKAELKFLGTITKLRPPTSSDRFHWGGKTDFISQPTGLDISTDGMEAAVITYRSLYRFRRDPGEDWLSALQRKPDEVVGPPSIQNEAIAYSVDGKGIYVTTEKKPSPVFRFEFSDVELK